MVTLTRSSLFFVFSLLASCVLHAFAADCQTATVGSPDSTCFDIYTRAGITAAQFSSYNPGLDCTKLQIGQKVCISPGSLPSNAPGPSPNGTCFEYFVQPNDNCFGIATKFTITVDQIEEWNKNTWKWKGCSGLQIGLAMCVSPGDPPPIPIIPGLQCGPQSEGNKTCPLNACCSAFGFCGLTDEFCTTTGPNPCISNCGQPTLPSCSPGSTLGRYIAYYAGWGNRRTCGTNVAPADVNWEGFTDVKFAFATISQGMEIQLADQDIPLLKELVSQKDKYPSMKVTIALGGWDFSEMEPTRDLFSVMIGTSGNRATFISSVKSMLSTYQLDGIDIDFEYPGAIERGAPATDTPNLTAFFKELRAGISSAIVSCATPAGYWFLKGFEIDKIVENVDYLNMMSYDYHGQWDTNVTDQAPVTNPHTSLLDMETSALLYLRAGIDLSKVNLGLAWYGRTYHVADSSCTGYNCTMTGGGFPGDCSVTSGYLTQFEIDGLLNTGISPTLDSPSQTYWFNDQGALITFDQDDTWNAKTNFATTRCFGGTFIWSVDQRTDNLADGGGSGSGSGAAGQYTQLTWNPNPYPSSGARSETFVQSAGNFPTVVTSVVNEQTRTVTDTAVIPAHTSTDTQWTSVGGTITSTVVTTQIPASTITRVRTLTSTSVVSLTSTVSKSSTVVIIPVPTVTTTVTIEGLVITLASGGTPVNSPLPTYISMPSAVTPTWTFNILPPPDATSVTFTAPLTSSPTWSSTVRVPPKSTDPPATVTGPPGSHDDRCDSGSNIFELLFNHVIDGCMPAIVGIRGGITPTPIKPPGWTGPWSDPHPLPTGPPPGPGEGDPTTTEQTTTTSSTSTTSICALQTQPPYDLPSDPENGDDEDSNLRKRTQGAIHQARANGRSINVNSCNIHVTNQNQVNLGAGAYLTVGSSPNIRLQSYTVGSRPQDGAVIQEHIFELRYIDDFFGKRMRPVTGCSWIQNNVFNVNRDNGQNLGEALLDAIDTTANMVWADEPMNQAKSNVVGNTRGGANEPPQMESVDIIGDFDGDDNLIYNVEFFIRSIAALGEYFGTTSNIFRATAQRVQTLLSEVTPDSVPDQTQSLPMIFNSWLSGVVSGYPNGCTTRANNIWNYYREHMEIIADEEQVSVPVCFAVYNTYGRLHVPFTPSSFNYQNLLPNAPRHPGCNVPGTTGTVGYFVQNNFVTHLTQQRVLGAGNTDFYALGSGARLSPGQSRWQAIDLGSVPGTSSSCANVYAVNDFVPTNAQPSTTVNIAFQCGTATGRQNANFAFVLNGQGLGCAKFETGHAGGTTVTLLCAVNQGSALACAQASGGNAAAIQMAFVP